MAHNSDSYRSAHCHGRFYTLTYAPFSSELHTLTVGFLMLYRDVLSADS